MAMFDWIYGLGQCPLCKERSTSARGCCDSCAWTLEQSLRPKQTGFELTLGVYDGLLDQAIHAFKFNHVRRLHVLLAELLAREVAKASYLGQHPSSDAGAIPWQIDVVCAVPLHWRRKLQRGYNQAELLAKAMADVRNLPYQSLLTRPERTQQQAKLDRNERLANIAGAFTSEPLDGERVLLVDDVITTGATTTECALALFEAGAKCVYTAGLARAA